jgi:hypothetical protein
MIEDGLPAGRGVMGLPAPSMSNTLADLPINRFNLRTSLRATF